MPGRKRKAEREEQYRSPEFARLQGRLAKNLRALRREYGWTQEDAAHACSMSVRLFQGLEAGRTNATLTTLARLVEGFEVDVGQLFAPGRRKA